MNDIRIGLGGEITPT